MLCLYIRPRGNAQKRHCLASLDNLPSTQWIATNISLAHRYAIAVQPGQSGKSEGRSSATSINSACTVPAYSDAADSRRVSPQAHAACSMQHSASCACKRNLGCSQGHNDVQRHGWKTIHPRTLQQITTIEHVYATPDFAGRTGEAQERMSQARNHFVQGGVFFWVDIELSRQQARAGEFYVSYGQQYMLLLVSPSVAAPAGISREASPLVARLQPYRTIGRNCMSLLMGRL